MSDRPAPRSTGKPACEVTLTGMLLPWNEEQPSLVQLPGAGDTYLLAVALFTTVEKLQSAVVTLALPCERIKQITDGTKFLTSIPSDILVVLDPWITPEGATRYMQVFRD